MGWILLLFILLNIICQHFPWVKQNVHKHKCWVAFISIINSNMSTLLQLTRGHEMKMGLEFQIYFQCVCVYQRFLQNIRKCYPRKRCYVHSHHSHECSAIICWEQRDWEYVIKTMYCQDVLQLLAQHFATIRYIVRIFSIGLW